MKDCFYYEHHHTCSECGKRYQTFWAYEIKDGIYCPCSGVCKHCTEKLEDHKPMHTQAWREENRDRNTTS